MATRKTTKKRTPTKRKTVASVKQKQHAMIGSIALFATGLLFIVMLFVQGMSAWAATRDFLFGIFGIGFYFLGVAIIYLAVLVAQQEHWGMRAFKIGLGLATLSGTAILFSKVEIAGLAIGETCSLFYQNGIANTFGGGLMGGIFGAPLLALCGRPAANILVVILFVCVAMFFTGVTPAEILFFVEDYFDRMKEHSSDARDSFLQKQEEHNQARQVRAEAHNQARQARAEALANERARKAVEQAVVPEESNVLPDALEPNDAPKPWFKLFARQIETIDDSDKPVQEAVAPTPEPRAFFDIDLGPEASQVKVGGSEPIEPIEIGPGGTFGLEAVRGVMAENAVPKTADIDIPLGDTRPSGEVEVNAEVFWQVPVESGVATAPVSVSSPVAVPVTQDGWISMSETPEPETDVVSSETSGIVGVQTGSAQATSPLGNAEIEHLAAAAMVKPELAEAAVAATSTEQAPVTHSYRYPPIHLFEPSRETQDLSAEAELKANAQKLVDTLESFGVKTRILDISRGPSVTRYELQPLAGVKISRITNLSDDIALNLSVAGVRMEAPIPGKPAVGIEVPNRHSSSVAIRSILESTNYIHMESPLTFALGKDIAGVAQVADLCKMPHLLVAGSTGSGKSVCMNSIIISFLFRASPEDLKMILIDPKVVELAEYNGIPHLLMPVVTEPRKAAGALGSAVAEMEKRYRMFADNNVRDIKTYNKLVEGIPGMERLPYIAIVIDELADLMMVSGKEVEDYICRIAQKARAAGMHLIVATQRPSVDVITGLIKANIPSRISFAVSSQIDSRTILDAGGAEKLLGMGDMLFMPVGASKPTRIQGTYVRDEEISRVLNFLKQSGTSQYNEEMIAEMEKVAASQKGAAGSGTGGGKADANDGDPMLKQCAEVVIEAGQASTSLLQRRCKLGYARAARIMDEMEQLNIIGPYEGAKPRAVLVSRQQWIEMCMNETDAEQEPV